MAGSVGVENMGRVWIKPQRWAGVDGQRGRAESPAVMASPRWHVGQCVCG